MKAKAGQTAGLNWLNFFWKEPMGTLRVKLAKKIRNFS